jgi:hypothetical protein
MTPLARLAAVVFFVIVAGMLEAAYLTSSVGL